MVLDFFSDPPYHEFKSTEGDILCIIIGDEHQFIGHCSSIKILLNQKWGGRDIRLGNTVYCVALYGKGAAGIGTLG